MYKKVRFSRSGFDVNESTEGATIEQKIERIINNKEAITDNAPIIFTEKSEGVNASYNIRTDRFEIAIDGIDKIQKSYQARNEAKAKLEVIRESESTEGTKNQQVGK